MTMKIKKSRNPLFIKVSILTYSMAIRVITPEVLSQSFIHQGFHSHIKASVLGRLVGMGRNPLFIKVSILTVFFIDS